jgi:hypothetical protein
MQSDLFDPINRLEIESQKRDTALSRLEHHRRELVILAREIAISHSHTYKRVSSTDVLRIMRAGGVITDEDPRFLGCVFRGKEWEPIGWESTGSHRRPVRVWRYVGTDWPQQRAGEPGDLEP